jgi:ABC-type transport system substrate-binding protein
MNTKLRIVAVVGTLIALCSAGSAFAQKRGGILKSYSIDSPASMSIHEEVTVYSLRPVMGVFNNLVLYDQHVKQNSMQSIVPELANSWTWDEDGTRLTFKLHEGVKWHDGKPFTARDVKCTWDLLQGKASERLRINPRKAWYRNLEEVTTNGDYEATFVFDICIKAAAARFSRAARLRVFAGLSLPCLDARDAPTPNRHRPVQIRRIQAERVDQAGAQPRLLETGSSLP